MEERRRGRPGSLGVSLQGGVPHGDFGGAEVGSGAGGRPSVRGKGAAWEVLGAMKGSPAGRPWPLPPHREAPWT